LEEDHFSKILGRQVKVVFVDDGRTKVVTGILNVANSNLVMVDDVIIGLGPGFISCIPVEGNNGG
jgi:ribosome maturation factor RimP